MRHFASGLALLIVGLGSDATAQTPGQTLITPPPGGVPIVDGGWYAAGTEFVNGMAYPAGSAVSQAVVSQQSSPTLVPAALSYQPSGPAYFGGMPLQNSYYSPGYSAYRPVYSPYGLGYGLGGGGYGYNRGLGLGISLISGYGGYGGFGPGYGFGYGGGNYGYGGIRNYGGVRSYGGHVGGYGGGGHVGGHAGGHGGGGHHHR